MPSTLESLWVLQPLTARLRALKRGVPKRLYPYNEQARYRKLTVGIVRLLKKKTMEIINRSSLKSLWDSANPRLDSWSDDLNEMLITLSTVKLSEEEIHDVLNSIGLDVEDVDSENWSRFTKAMVGVDLVTYEPWIADMRDAWISSGTSLIKTLSEKTVDNVRFIITQGISSGDKVQNIWKDLYGDKGVFAKSESHAKLLARDQVAKYNGNLWKKRNVDAGIEMYVWRDSDDERVRGRHADNDGRVFTWTKPPSNGTGHPTEDYQCRCDAEPIMLFGLSRQKVSSMWGKYADEVFEIAQTELQLVA